MRSPSIPLALSLILLFSGAGCSQCGKAPSGVAPETFIEASTPGAVSIPSLEKLTAQANDFYKHVSANPKAAAMVTQYRAMTQMLGFDPLDPKGLAGIGIDPRGAAAMGQVQDQPIFVLPIGDASKFDATVLRLARDHAQAGVRTVVKVGAVDIITFRANADADPAVGYVLKGSQAIITGGGKIKEALTAAGKLKIPSLLAFLR